ncbi:MAG: pyridoxamine 5'-phosphate oxidase family protein [Synechococcales cyanobacterium T60_A2020_003]|nr:pyridoxamine 5'-phosphate oxidase family protein [Synechococcales cyanobacterium T60_A2020_003]
MAKVFPHITPDLQTFMQAQQMFFVATAPLGADGHVNVSPKGLDCFRILSDTQVAYLDLTGSGNETSAHLQENGRITFMFCAFQGKPVILRLYGKGKTYLPGQDDWADLVAHFPPLPGVRQIIVADLNRVQTSCGTGVPLYVYQGQRDELIQWAEQKGTAEIATYQQTKNLVSIDGLPTPLNG